MSLLEKIKRNRDPVSIELDGETFYFARLSAKQKDRFDIQWGKYREWNDGSGEGLRGFVVAFCLCDSDGVLQFDSGSSPEPSKTFLEAAEAIMDGDANIVEPLFETAAKANGFIEDTEKN